LLLGGSKAPGSVETTVDAQPTADKAKSAKDSHPDIEHLCDGLLQQLDQTRRCLFFNEQRVVNV
jgi:hypothetical protein